MYSTRELAAAFAVDENTLRGWISVAQLTHPLGARDGGRRVFDDREAFGIGLLSGVYHCQVRLSPELLADVLDAAFADKPPDQLVLRESAATSLAIDMHAARALVTEKLQPLQAVSAEAEACAAAGLM